MRDDPLEPFPTLLYLKPNGPYQFLTSREPFAMFVGEDVGIYELKRVTRYKLVEDIKP